MVKKIFWRENYDNDKQLKKPMRILPGERRNLRSDKKRKSKYNGFTKNDQVINYILPNKMMILLKLLLFKIY
jgi:hypothetical protein